MFRATALSAFVYLAAVTAQQAGTQTAETHPSLTWSQCTSSGCTSVQGSVTLDANWRWVHDVGGYTVSMHLIVGTIALTVGCRIATQATNGTPLTALTVLPALRTAPSTAPTTQAPTASPLQATRSRLRSRLARTSARAYTS